MSYGRNLVEILHGALNSDPKCCCPTAPLPFKTSGCGCDHGPYQTIRAWHGIGVKSVHPKTNMRSSSLHGSHDGDEVHRLNPPGDTRPGALTRTDEVAVLPVFVRLFGPCCWRCQERMNSGDPHEVRRTLVNLFDRCRTDLKKHEQQMSDSDVSARDSKRFISCALDRPV